MLFDLPRHARAEVRDRRIENRRIASKDPGAPRSSAAPKATERQRGFPGAPPSSQDPATDTGQPDIAQQRPWCYPACILVDRWDIHPYEGRERHGSHGSGAQGPVRNELGEIIAKDRTEVTHSIVGVRTELKEGIAGVRTELKEGIAATRNELSLRIDETNRQQFETNKRLDRLFEIIVRREEFSETVMKVLTIEREINDIKRIISAA